MKKIALITLMTFSLLCAKAQVTNLASITINTGDNKPWDILYIGSDYKLHPIHLGPVGYVLQVITVNGVNTLGYVNPATITALKGAPGATGPQGPIGLTGLTGLTGASGTAGVDGGPGIAGPQGIQGLTGLQGAAGAQGPQGIAAAGIPLKGKPNYTVAYASDSTLIAVPATWTVSQGNYKGLTATQIFDTAPAQYDGTYQVFGGITPITLPTGSSIILSYTYPDHVTTTSKITVTLLTNIGLLPLQGFSQPFTLSAGDIVTITATLTGTGTFNGFDFFKQIK